VGHLEEVIPIIRASQPRSHAPSLASRRSARPRRRQAIKIHPWSAPPSTRFRWDQMPCTFRSRLRPQVEASVTHAVSHNSSRRIRTPHHRPHPDMCSPLLPHQAKKGARGEVASSPTSKKSSWPSKPKRSRPSRPSSPYTAPCSKWVPPTTIRTLPTPSRSSTTASSSPPPSPRHPHDAFLRKCPTSTACQEEGHRPARQLLLPQPRPRAHRHHADRIKDLGSTTPPSADFRDSMTVIPEANTPPCAMRKSSHRRPAAVPRRRHHQRRAQQTKSSRSGPPSPSVSPTRCSTT